MVRSEFLAVGIILVLVGLGVSYLGYQKTQPTLADQAVSFLETVAGEPAPAELKRSTVPGYLWMVIGGGVFVVGLGVILNSRAKSQGQQREE